MEAGNNIEYSIPSIDAARDSRPFAPQTSQRGQFP